MHILLTLAGDLLAIFSQYGEIIDLDLVRDRATGKSKVFFVSCACFTTQGFAFIGFEDQRSTVLTVDNLNGIKVASPYRLPKQVV